MSKTEDTNKSMDSKIKWGGLWISSQSLDELKLYFVSFFEGELA